MSGSGREGGPTQGDSALAADQGFWKRATVGIVAAGVLFAVLGAALQTTVGPGIGLAMLVVAATLAASSVEIVKAYEKRALTVFGDYRGLVGPGLNFVPPFVSETTVYDMRTQTIDVPKQEAITRDNSPVIANAVIYIRVMNAERAFLEVEDYERAVSNLAQTTLRAVLGDMELDETLSRRREINERIRRELDGPTDEWGVRVESVEVREITPSTDVLNSMEQQTAAERRRRAMILEAQGERRSAIERAQGDKQSNIVRAQGEKQAQILQAQGDAVSTVLRAKAAEAMGERAVIDKGIDTLAAIGTSESTTYVLPQEVSSLLGRYGKHLTGSTVSDGQQLESKAFDAETAELLGLDDIEELASESVIDAHGDDAGSEVEAVAEADDNVAESETMEEADEAGAGPVDADAGEAQESVESAAEQARRAVEDAVPDVEVKTGREGPDGGETGASADGSVDRTAPGEDETAAESEAEAETETDAERN